MLTNDEVEALLRRTKHFSYDEYTRAYQRVDSRRGHRARMQEIMATGQNWWTLPQYQQYV
jgi:hypothetical protein